MRINQNNININGTHFVGYLITTYDVLTKVLGNPFPDGYDDYKTDAEWWIEFDDGTVATIYNYKNGKNYCREDGLEVEEITEWNVGGHNSATFEKVMGLFQAN